MDGQITMRERLAKLEEAINGNGKEGIKTEVALIKQKQEDMNESLESIATSISALAKSQTEQDTISKFREENKARIAKSFGLVGISVSIAGGLFGMLYLILDHIG